MLLTINLKIKNFKTQDINNSGTIKMSKFEKNIIIIKRSEKTFYS